MIVALIRWSITHRRGVLMASALVALAALWSVRHTAVDALPDLSDVQVIVRTSYPGNPPRWSRTWSPTR